MDGIALQIDGKWVTLPNDINITIEEHSPIWEETGTFSYPFELDIEPNRSIFGNSDQLTGQSIYKAINKKRAVIYLLGIPFFAGQVELEDEVEVQNGKIELNIISGNKSFDDMISEMNCQDVELIDEISVGEGVDYCTFEETFYRTKHTVYLPSEMMHMKVDGISTVNVSMPYPNAKYCNARICYQLPDKPTTQSLASKYRPTEEDEYRKQLKIGTNDYGRYVVLEADRPLSGLCFFVMYFFDCLFNKLKINYDLSKITSMEDMNHLIFFNTKCSCTFKDTGSFINSTQLLEIVPSYFYFGDGSTTNRKFHKCTYIADSKNFPDVEVGEVVEAIENAFGVKFLYDNKLNKIDAFFIKNILSDKTVLYIKNLDVYSIEKHESSINGFRLKYSGSDDDNTSFNYSDWKNMDLSKDYKNIKNEVYSNNKNLYIDEKTGDAYRIKVNEEAETEEELDPSLFELAEYIPVEYGDCSNEDNTETIEIGFTPIIQNDVSRGSDEQIFSTFLNIDMQYPSFVPMVIYDLPGISGTADNSWEYSYFSAQRSSSSEKKRTILKSSYVPYKLEEENSLRDYDTGLTLGIMRGPGNGATVTYYEEGYDGEGNSKWVETPENYAISSDTIDNYGRLFDYNGAEPDGVDVEGRFSLKLKAEKPAPDALKEMPDYDTYYQLLKPMGYSDEEILEMYNQDVRRAEYCQKYGYLPITESYAQKRGLFDKFYTEYAYFVVNRKIAKMTCRMEIADLISIDWTKRYKIGDVTGFIKNYSYTVGNDGIGEVELEMYYI